jgi:alpha-2-macroglobulin
MPSAPGRILKSIQTFFQTILSFIFGEIQWRPPIWLRPIGRSIGGHRILWSLATLGIVICAFAVYFVQHLPQPQFCGFTAYVPEITPLEKELKPNPATIVFQYSAAPLGKIGLTVDLQMTPHLAGEWRWRNDRTLVFSPSEDWPPNTRYQVTLPQSELANNIRLKSNVAEFTTQPLEVQLKDPKFYQDPVDVDKRQVIATVETNFPVELDAVKQQANLQVLGGSNLFGGKQPLEIVPDLFHKRRFFLRTANVILPDHEDFVLLTIKQGLVSASGTSRTTKDEVTKVRVPDRYSFFSIEGVESSTARRDNGDIAQLIVVSTSTNTKAADIASAIQVWLLPNKKNVEEGNENGSDNSDSKATDEDNKNSDSKDSDSKDSDSKDSSDSTQIESKNDDANDTGNASDENGSDSGSWKSPGEITDEVLKTAQRLAITLEPEKEKFSQEHLFRCVLPKGGQLFVKVPKNTPAVGGYLLGDDYQAIVDVDPLPREIQIQGKGGILALGGERTLSVITRGVQDVEFEIAKVLPGQINHLVTQTSGSFNKLEFLGDNFDQNNISVINRPRLQIADDGDGTAKYSSLVLDPYLTANGKIQYGLFFIRSKAIDPHSHKKLKARSETRFVLVTDLGILVKRNNDHSREIFVVSLKDQTPVPDAHVSLLGKNGLAVFDGATDENGHIHSPALAEAEGEREPAAIVAQLGNDLSFMPYERDDNLVDFSSFEIDGEVSPAADTVEAFPFTERGIYRPGETVHVGLIVRSLHSASAEIPLVVNLDDSSGTSVGSEVVKTPGLAETNFELPADAGTGEYHLTVHLQNKDQTQIAEEYFHVEDFQPDRMKLTASVDAGENAAWVTPDQLAVNVHLENLFGTPAVGNRIAAKQKVSVGEFQLSKWKEFSFFNPTIYPDNHPKYDEEEELEDQNADSQGNSIVKGDLSKYANACYRVDFDVEGFESDGGRSVHKSVQAIVADRDYVLGYRTAAQLDFLPYNQPTAIELLAVNKAQVPVGLTNCRFRLIELVNEPVLTKQDNGTFKYETVSREKTVQDQGFALENKTTSVSLPTNEAGKFRWEVVDQNGTLIFSLEYTVVGANQRLSALGEKTDLNLKLSKKTVAPGENLQVSLQAPYDGYGLIAVERDKTYAWKWFRASRGMSVQEIQVPANFTGYGYINVSFVRSLNSQEVYASPLSYAAVPFKCVPPQREIKLALEAPKRSKPGDKLPIKVRADRNCKLVLFAVDTGILQVSDYETPDPLAWQFRKRQLEVQTYEIVESLLPEYSKLKQIAGSGGGEEGHVEKNLNPFSRVSEKPVVFWSGVISAGPQPIEVDYVVPEFFDGSVRIMAVAESADGEGSAQSESAIHGPIIITPQAPLFSAPGDQFLTSATLTNATENDLSTNVHIECEGGVTAVGQQQQTISLHPGASQTLRWQIRTTDTLGNAVIRFVATAPTELVHRQRTLSVRPAAPFLTLVESGKLAGGGKEVPLTQEFYPQFESRTVIGSSSPVLFVNGLHQFLETYPYDCSEQLTSKELANLALISIPGSGLTKTQLASKLQSYFKIIRDRQGSSGAIGYWTVDDARELDPISVYVLEFITDAKLAGIAVPSDIDKAGANYLKKVASATPSDLQQAEVVAKAIYLLTRREQVMTNELVSLRDTLDREYPDQWKQSITGVYVAASAELLMKEREANDWISHYRLTGELNSSGLWSSLTDYAQYLTVLARHFPQRFRSLGRDQVEQILKPIWAADYNTLSAAECLRALVAGQNLIELNKNNLRISQWNGNWQPLATNALGLVTIGNEVTKVKFDPNQSGAGYFQVIQSGFPKNVKPFARGLDLRRDFLDDKNQPISSVSLGDQIKVRLRIRSTTGTSVDHVAISDLLPAGFEPVRDEKGGVALAADGLEHSDVREDRVLIYLTADTKDTEITYEAKATVPGSLIVPPVAAQAMYDQAIQVAGETGRIEVKQP